MGKVVIEDGAAIPAAVKRQAEMDERLQQAEIAARKAALAAKAGGGNGDGSEGDLGTPPEPPPQTPPQPQRAEPASQPDTSGLMSQIQQLQSQLGLERQRNQTLQGQMKALGPQTADIIKDLRSQVDELKQQVADQRNNRPQVPAHMLYLKPEEREVYQNAELPPEVRMSQGLVDGVMAQVQKQYRTLSDEIAAMKQGSTADREAQQRAMLMEEVEKILPGARLINSSPEFNNWLDYPDHRSRTGATYGDRGGEAMGRGDVDAIAALIQDFLASGQLTDPRITAQIKPGATRATPAVKQPQRPDMVPLSEIHAFYNDVARNKARNPDGSLMTSEQVRETEAKIDLAIKENRVRDDM